MDAEPGRDNDAKAVRVEAIGEPGQRRFRLLVVVSDETVIAWMEKQQLQALGLALEQMLDQLPERENQGGPTIASTGFDPDTRRQFRTGRMELGYDERGDRVVIVAHDVNTGENEDLPPSPRLAFGISRAAARQLSEEAAEVVAAGRPRCTMCGVPMGPGPHVCPQQNGHFPHEVLSFGPDDADEDETDDEDV